MYMYNIKAFNTTTARRTHAVSNCPTDASELIALGLLYRLCDHQAPNADNAPILPLLLVMSRSSQEVDLLRNGG
jgi:hypothetical protein